MKKVSALSIALLSIYGSAIAHDDFKLKFGGRIDTQIGHIQQKGDFNQVQDTTGTNQGLMNKTAIVNDTIVTINADGVTENGLKYGGLIWLHADTSKATNDEIGVADKTMIYIQHDKIGRLEGGNYPGAGGVFEMDTTNFTKAGYGVMGYWSKWINQGTYTNVSVPGISVPAIPAVQYYFNYAPTINLYNLPGGNAQRLLPDLGGYKYLVSPDLPSNYSGQNYSDAPKLTFYTEPLKGLYVGISYIPDMDSTGTVNGIAPKEGGPVDWARASKGFRPTFRNIWSGGFQYKGEYQDWKYKGSLVGEIGKTKKYRGTDFIRDLKAYEAGLAITYKTITLAGSYGNWLKTAGYKQTFADTKQGGDYWTLVFAQDIENFGYSLSYMQSRRAGGLEAIGGQIQALAANNLPASLTQLGFTNNPNYTPVPDVNYSDKRYNKFTNISLGAEYKLAPGFLPYAELSHFKFKDANAVQNNKGYLLLTGVRLSF